MQYQFYKKAPQQEGQGKADLEEGVIGNQEFDRWAGYKQLEKLGLFFK